MAFAGLEKTNAEPNKRIQFFIEFWSNFGFKLEEKAENNREGVKIAFGTVFGDAFLATGPILVDFLVPAGSQKLAKTRKKQYTGSHFYRFQKPNA